MPSVPVSRQVIQQMIDHALHEHPNECCGVLGGKANLPETIYPLRNDQSSPTRYFGSPQELFQAVKSMRARGEEMTGIYHSHPTGLAYPSQTDLRENYYPGLYYFIIALIGAPEVRCFQLPEEGGVIDVEIVPF